MRALIGAIALTALPAGAQAMQHDQHTMPGMDMPGMDMPKPTAPKPATPDPASALAPASASAPASKAMPGMDMSDAPPAAAEPEVGTALAPPVPTDLAAARFYPGGQITRSRGELNGESHFTTAALFVDRLEYRAVRGADGYGWKAQGWVGGDIDRIALTTEGEGSFGQPAERAEFSLLWRHSIAPYFNLEAGVRHDFHPAPQRSYAVLGIEGLAPYWIEVEGQLLVSNKGDIHARVSASHDWRLTNRLILQPEIELNAAFQAVPALNVGAGLERIETGLRLRYQVTPELAPYVGVHWEARLGDTAHRQRLAGERVSAVSAVAGVRFWF